MKKIKIEMEITYDEEVDIGYIYFKKITKGEASGERKFCSCRDFDKDGRILGIEIFNASSQIPQEIMDKFKDDENGD